MKPLERFIHDQEDVTLEVKEAPIGIPLLSIVLYVCLLSGGLGVRRGVVVQDPNEEPPCFGPG